MHRSCEEVTILTGCIVGAWKRAFEIAIASVYGVLTLAQSAHSRSWWLPLPGPHHVQPPLQSIRPPHPRRVRACLSLCRDRGIRHARGGTHSSTYQVQILHTWSSCDQSGGPGCSGPGHQTAKRKYESITRKVAQGVECPVMTLCYPTIRSSPNARHPPFPKARSARVMVSRTGPERSLASHCSKVVVSLPVSEAAAEFP